MIDRKYDSDLNHISIILLNLLKLLPSKAHFNIVDNGYCLFDFNDVIATIDNMMIAMSYAQKLINANALQFKINDMGGYDVVVFNSKIGSNLICNRLLRINLESCDEYMTRNIIDIISNFKAENIEIFHRMGYDVEYQHMTDILDGEKCYHME